MAIGGLSSNTRSLNTNTLSLSRPTGAGANSAAAALPKDAAKLFARDTFESSGGSQNQAKGSDNALSAKSGKGVADFVGGLFSDGDSSSSGGIGGLLGGLFGGGDSSGGIGGLLGSLFGGGSSGGLLGGIGNLLGGLFGGNSSSDSGSQKKSDGGIGGFIQKALPIVTTVLGFFI